MNNVSCFIFFISLHTCLSGNFELNVILNSSQLDAFKKQRKLFFVVIIPLRAKQVSEANLSSEQGGINFTPFVLSLPYAKKNLKLKFPIWMGVSSKMSVCLLYVCLSVVCDEFVPNYLLNRLSDWAKIFSQKLEKMCI